MSFIPIKLKPGINRESTQYAEGGGWYDCDKVRFRHGNPEKIGGWVKATAANFKGVCRLLHNWITLAGKDLLALGTSRKFYIEQAGVFYNITPPGHVDAATNNAITTGGAGAYTHTYSCTAAHGAIVGDTVTLSGVADISGICTSTLVSPFTTTAIGSSIVNVTTPTPHFASEGQSVTFSGASAVGGIAAVNFNTTLAIVSIVDLWTFTVNVASNATSVASGGGTVTAVFLSRLNRDFFILSVPSATTFTFQTDFPSAAVVTGGGAACVASFEMNIGYAYDITGGGWGAGTWSRLTWSSPVTSSVSGIAIRLWSADHFGEDLIFCLRDGPLFYWDATNGLTTRGVLLSGMVGATDAPNQVSIVRVTDERHVVAFGATDRISTIFDPLLIRWTDQEDPLNWTPGSTTTAGSQRIPMGSYVVAVVKARQETLIWTDSSLHSLQYVGVPYTFGLQTLAENVTIAGPNAAVNINNVTYWMGKNRFWVYSGRVQNLSCTVQRYVFDNLNMEQLSQVYATTNDGFTEVTWFYCSLNSGTVDSYVSYHYEDQLWTIGTLPRSSMLQCSGRSNGVYATDGGYSADDGTLYIHEVGCDDGSTNPPKPVVSWITSSDIDLQSGDKMMFIDRILPDVTFERSTQGSPWVDFTVSVKKFPGQSEQDRSYQAVSQTGSVDEFTNDLWVRLRGRSLRLNVTSNGIGIYWLLGTVRINVRLDGRQ